MSRKMFSVYFSVLLVIFSSSWGVANEKKPEFRLTYSNYFPPTHKMAILGQEFCQEIEKQSEGRVKITYYPGGTMTKAEKVFDGVVMGVSDIGMSNLAYTRGRFPVMEALDLPLGNPSGWVSTHLANDFYQKFKPEEFEKVHVLYFHSCGPNIIYTTEKQVQKLEDLKGLVIRGTGRIADTVSALGATASPISMPEAYEALSKGVISGVMGPMEMLKGFRTADVTKFATNCWQVGNVYTFYVTMNKKKWENLPEDIKQVFNTVSTQWIEKHAVGWNEIDKIGKNYFEGLGGTVLALSKDEIGRWKAAVEPTVTQYVKEMKEQGFDAGIIQQHIEYIHTQLPYWIQKQNDAGERSPYMEEVK